jgi:tetratricopeptide (TPR) repeat protein
MILCYRFLILVVLLLITSPAFSIEWHKAYERGRDRIKSGNCSEGQALMQEALRGNSKADPRTPTYGTMVIEYFPQYYLAVCAVESGKLQEAQRYLKESEGSRIASSKLAGEYQNLKARLNGLLQQQQQKTVETKPPVKQNVPAQQQVTQEKPTPPPPEKKAPQRIEPVVRDNSAAINAAFREARDSFRNGRYDEARAAANRVIGMQPDHREARNLLNDIASRQAAEQQARGKQQKIKEVEQAIRRGDLDTAENVALALKIQYPSDSRVAELLENISDERTNAGDCISIWVVPTQRFPCWKKRMRMRACNWPVIIFDGPDHSQVRSLLLHTFRRKYWIFTKHREDLRPNEMSELFHRT